MARRTASRLLDRRIRLHPKADFDASDQVLWVRRKNPVERLAARVIRRDPRVRLELDTRSSEVLAHLARLEAPSGRDLAAALGLAADEKALARRDPDLAALLVFLSTLERGGALVTEPI